VREFPSRERDFLHFQLPKVQNLSLKTENFGLIFVFKMLQEKLKDENILEKQEFVVVKA
jgi:hypothetical protein